MSKIILIGLLLVGFLQAERFDPKTYEANLVANDKRIKANIEKTISQCKVFAKKAKDYRKYLDDNKISNKYSEATIKACQKRIRDVCGNIMSKPN